MAIGIGATRQRHSAVLPNSKALTRRSKPKWSLSFAFSVAPILQNGEITLPNCLILKFAHPLLQFM